MRLVYVDEAGISKPDKEPFLVVAAVIVDADKKLVAVQRHLEKLVRRHIPAECQDGFVFHAHELFNGTGKVFDSKDPSNPKWPIERRLKIADDLAAIPKKFDLPLAFGWVEKSQFPVHEPARQHFATQNARQQLIITHVCAFMSCALMVEHWMRQVVPNEVCLMVVEDNDQARNFIRETQKAHQSSKLTESLTDEQRRYFPLKKIKEAPLFQGKADSAVLQLADFCAYVYKKFLMKDERYDPRFIRPIWGQLVDPHVPMPNVE